MQPRYHKEVKRNSGKALSGLFAKFMSTRPFEEACS